MVAQTIQFDTVSPSEIGSGTVTAFLFLGTTLSATLGSIAENGTLKGRHTGVVNDIAAAEYQLVVKYDGITISEPDYKVTLLLAVGTYVAARLAVLDSASVNAVADQVWDEAYADHNTAGSFGKLLNTIRKANLAIDGTVSVAITPTTLTFSSNVAATTSAYAHAVLLFTTGALAGENSPIISYTNTNGVFLLEEPLTSAPSNGDEFVVIAGSHVHSVADIQSGLSTLTAPQVNSEVLDVLSVDTFVELTSPPAATSSLKDKLTWLFMWVRNKGTATATQRKLYADDGTTLISTEVITDDGTTFTKGEAS